jgi:hypothetical protein
LANWNCFDEIDKEKVLNILKSKHLPKPKSWAQLLMLWNYIADDLVGYHYYRKHKEVRIFPVHGSNVLFSASEIVRLGEKKLLQSEKDWQFLSKYLLVLNQNWLRYLAEQRRKAEQHEIEELENQVEFAYKVLDKLGLSQSSDVSQVIRTVTNKFYEQEDCDIKDCIRLAQLAASLGASVSENFEFVVRDNFRLSVQDYIIADLHNDLDIFVPDEWYERHVLHQEYWFFSSCTKEEWKQWILSGRSGLMMFVPIEQMRKRVFGQKNIIEIVRDRGLKCEHRFPYVTSDFILEDWDFADEHWQNWHSIAQEDESFYGRILFRILEQPQSFWSKPCQHGFFRLRRQVPHGPLQMSHYCLYGSSNSAIYLACRTHTANIGNLPSFFGVRQIPRYY